MEEGAEDVDSVSQFHPQNIIPQIPGDQDQIHHMISGREMEEDEKEMKIEKNEKAKEERERETENRNEQQNTEKRD